MMIKINITKSEESDIQNVYEHVMNILINKFSKEVVMKYISRVPAKYYKYLYKINPDMFNSMDDVVRYFVYNDPRPISYIDNLSEEQYIDLTKYNGSIISRLDKISKNLAISALRRDGNLIQYMDIKDIKLCYEAIRSKPESVKHIHKDILTVEMCIFAYHLNNKSICELPFEQQAEILKYIAFKREYV